MSPIQNSHSPPIPPLHPHQRPGRLLLSCAAAALLGLLALTKGTMLVFAVATIGLVGLQAVIVREFRRLAALAGAFAAALLGCWLAAGQDPRHLPAFVHGINELSSGYNGTFLQDWHAGWRRS